MSKVLKYLPELKDREQVYVAQLLTPMDEDGAQQFAHVYRSRRKDPMIVLLTTLLVGIGIGGVNRFYLDQIGMGILYLLTAGLCLVGAIIDAVNYKDLAFKYNKRQADEVSALVSG